MKIQTKVQNLKEFSYQRRVDANFFRCGECQAEILFLVSGRQLIVGDGIGQVGMHQSTQCQAIVPARTVNVEKLEINFWGNSSTKPNLKLVMSMFR
jgi:hypothetical protein